MSNPSSPLVSNGLNATASSLRSSAVAQSPSTPSGPKVFLSTTSGSKSQQSSLHTGLPCTSSSEPVTVVVHLIYLHDSYALCYISGDNTYLTSFTKSPLSGFFNGSLSTALKSIVGLQSSIIDITTGDLTLLATVPSRITLDKSTHPHTLLRVFVSPCPRNTPDVNTQFESSTLPLNEASPTRWNYNTVAHDLEFSQPTNTTTVHPDYTPYTPDSDLVIQNTIRQTLHQRSERSKRRARLSSNRTTLETKILRDQKFLADIDALISLNDIITPNDLYPLDETILSTSDSLNLNTPYVEHPLSFG
jgi:hypothetical protein